MFFLDLELEASNKEIYNFQYELMNLDSRLEGSVPNSLFYLFIVNF